MSYRVGLLDEVKEERNNIKLKLKIEDHKYEISEETDKERDSQYADG